MIGQSQAIETKAFYPGMTSDGGSLVMMKFTLINVIFCSMISMGWLWVGMTSDGDGGWWISA